MKKPIIIGILVLLVAGGAITYALTNKKSDTNTITTAATPTVSATSGTNAFTITATDDNADLEQITVQKGVSVSITFKASTEGVYHGGLQFISTDPALDSGGIKPGASKTVTFTADKSFSFTPYWYESQVKKDYSIKVTVK